MSHFTKHSLIYSFSTENLNYLSSTNENYSSLKNKALTITGSGDQAIMLSLIGYKDIYLLDINEYANFYAELKLKALSIFNFTEFKYFFLNNKNIFQFKQYQRIKLFLSLEAQQFWDKQYDIYHYNGEILYKNLFHSKYDITEEKITNSFYLLHEEIYLKAQQSLLEHFFHFLCFPIKEISSLNHLMFDYILLSNLHDYSHLMYLNDKHIEHFKDFIIQPLYNKHLNKNGLIMIAYVFDNLNIFNSDKRNSFNLKNIRKNIYGNSFNYYEKILPSAIKNAVEDCICFIQKKDIYD